MVSRAVGGHGEGDPRRQVRSIARPPERATLRAHGAIAQLGERLDRTQEVSGSSPLSSTLFGKQDLGFAEISETARAVSAARKIPEVGNLRFPGEPSLLISCERSALSLLRGVFSVSGRLRTRTNRDMVKPADSGLALHTLTSGGRHELAPDKTIAEEARRAMPKTEAAFSDRLAEAWRALEAAEWDRARSEFDAVLATDDSPEALDGSGLAAWFLGDVDEGLALRAQAVSGYAARGRLRASGPRRAVDLAAAPHLGSGVRGHGMAGSRRDDARRDAEVRRSWVVGSRARSPGGDGRRVLSRRARGARVGT